MKILKNISNCMRNGVQLKIEIIARCFYIITNKS